jgi:hypothetical protein
MSTNNEHDEVAAAYIAAARHTLHHALAKITHCFNQLDDSHMAWRPFEQQNSLTNIILHLCGNIRQWIISAAGDTPDTRNRPAEFSRRQPLPKHELLSRLQKTIAEADAVVAALTAAKLLEKRRIQAVETTVLGAIFDCVAHLQGHTHQIVYITRFILREKYKFHYEPKTKEQGAAQT